jgi:hypothetical protein
MAKGWEVAIRVQENFAGFGSTVGTTSRPGWYLFADSESLKKNSEIKERDGKIIPMRLSPVQTANMEQQSPGGEITFQPRSDDCVPALMAFFQYATFMGGLTSTCYLGTGGTWVFTPIPKSLGWNGSNFGTSHIYSVNIDKYYGEGLAGTGDGIRFERGIVSKLTFTQEPASDLQFTTDMRFLQATDEVVLGTGFKSAPNVTGSFSQKQQYIDWNGTVSVQGTTYAIERITWEFDNMITERRKLGQRGFYQFPFGRAVFSGEFDLELEDMSAFKEGTTGGTVSCRWQSSDGDWIDVFAPNVFWRANDANVSDTGPVMRTIGFRCYPTAFSGSNAVVVSVYPKYGSSGPPSQSKLVFG